MSLDDDIDWAKLAIGNTRDGLFNYLEMRIKPKVGMDEILYASTVHDIQELIKHAGSVSMPAYRAHLYGRFNTMSLRGLLNDEEERVLIGKIQLAIDAIKRYDKLIEKSSERNNIVKNPRTKLADDWSKEAFDLQARNDARCIVHEGRFVESVERYLGHIDKYGSTLGESYSTSLYNALSYESAGNQDVLIRIFRNQVDIERKRRDFKEINDEADEQYHLSDKPKKRLSRQLRINISSNDADRQADKIQSQVMKTLRGFQKYNPTTSFGLISEEVHAE